MAVASDLFNEAVVIDTVEVVEEENDDSEKAVEIKENGLLKDTGASDVWWAFSSGTDYETDPTILYIGNSQADVAQYGAAKQIPYTWKQTNRFIFINKVIFVSKVRPTDTNGWFSSDNITSIEGMATYLDTSEVTAMNSMFAGCGCVPDLSGFDTSKVTDMNNMFSNMKCTALDVSSFDTSHVTNLSSMFSRCKNLTTLDLSGFDTSSATDMSQMFEECDALQTIYAGKGFVTDSVASSSGMFDGCNSLTGGAGTKTEGKPTDKTYARIDGGTEASGYFTAKNYTVTFASNGGSTVSPQTVLALDTVQKPADPEKDQYAFAGWYKDETLQEEWNFDTDKVKTNITLYAKWTVPPYDITYLDKGGSAFSGTHESGYPTTHTYGTATELKGATKTGYNFDGWFRESDCSGTAVTSLGATDYTAAITLYAKWTPKKYTITYKDQGDETFSGTHETDYPTAHTYGTETTLKGAKKDNYTFGGWFKESDCSGTAVTSLGAADYTANITLYAKWVGDSYTINYLDKGGSAFSGTHESGYPESHTYGTATELKGATKTGYNFDGWYTTSNCEDGTKVTILPAEGYTAAITLYAKWTPKTYTITYKDQRNVSFSGTHEDGYPTVHTYGTETTLKGATKDHYTFDGWYTASDCADDKKVTSLAADGYTSDITLYAKWIGDSYDIVYKDQGGEPFSGTHETGYPQKHIYGTDTTLKGATKTGYNFGGWYTDSACTDAKKVTVLPAETYTAEVTLYAKWTPKTFTITYKDQGDETFSGTHETDYPTAHTYGTETTLKGATKDHYTFDGWYTTSDCADDKKVTSLAADGYTSDITLYAKWVGDSYDIVYKDQGGSAFSGTHESGYPESHTYGTATELKGATKPGYDFWGWYSGSDCLGNSVTTLFATAYTESPVLYAKWVEKDAVTITYTAGKGGTVMPDSEDLAPATGVASGSEAVADTGYHFVNWTKNGAEVSTATHFVPEKVQGLNVAATYTANFEINTFKVTFSGNYTGATYQETVKETYGEKFVLPETNPERVGYTFAGWFTAEKEGEQVTSDTVVKITGEQTLYAHWAAGTDIEYQVKHQQQKTDGSGYILFETEKLTGTTGEKTDAAAKSYDGFTAGTVTQADIAADGSTVVEIKYDRNQYTITYNANGHGTAPEATTAFYGATISAPIDPEAEGYSFGGWYEDAACTTAYTFTVMPLGGKTVYAKWTKNDDPKPDPKPTPVYNDSKEEREPLFTGTWNNPVTKGSWSQDQNGVWHYTSSETFRYTWAYILNPYAKAGQHTSDWFWFDRQGNMLTGWQFINGKWYYLNPTKDGTLGACQLGGVTPDGWTVDESGAWIESIPKK